MVPIFPPRGPQDEARCRSLKREDREYFLFCLEFCSEILLKRPDQIEALEMAANHFTALGYYTDGLMLDQRLAMLKPRDPAVLYNLGCSFALIGRPDDAILTLARAVQYGYGDYRHMADDRDLSSLRADARFGELLAIVEKKRSG